MKIPERLLLKEGKSILLYDSREVRAGQKDVVLVFGHPKVIKSVYNFQINVIYFQLVGILKRSKKWSVDGTFKICPKSWKQNFTIGAFIKNRSIVCINALLPGKDIKYYIEVLSVVRNVIGASIPVSGKIYYYVYLYYFESFSYIGF